MIVEIYEAWTDVSDVQIINADCMYITYKSNEFRTPALNTNVIIASYLSSHARLELYRCFEMLEDRALYCDTDSIIYIHVDGMYNSPLCEFVGGMTNELGENYSTEYLPKGLKNYAYCTCDGIQVIKVKYFTSNVVASQHFTFDVMKEMAIAEQDDQLIVTELRIYTYIILKAVKLARCHPQSCS